MACIGGSDAHLPPTNMALGRIQDQKQKYNLEGPYASIIH